MATKRSMGRKSSALTQVGDSCSPRSAAAGDVRRCCCAQAGGSLPQGGTWSAGRSPVSAQSHSQSCTLALTWSCGANRGEQVLCLVAASQHRSVNITEAKTSPTELPVHRAQTTLLFLLPSPLPLSHHFSQLFLSLLCYLWRLKDHSYHLHSLHSNSFLSVTWDRLAAPPGLLVSALGCFWAMESSFAALGLGAWAQLEAKAGHTPCWGAQGTAIRHQPLLELFLQGHLGLGMFTVSPCSGSIAPWGQQKITVECSAGQEGTCEEHIYFDITSRDPTDNPLGIPFTLIAESCLPGTSCPQVPMVRRAADQHLNLLLG